MQSLLKTSLVETAVDSLRCSIADNHWNVGDRIPTETQLAQQLSVSRGTVREAVRVLVSQGMLETRQGSGTYVRSKLMTAHALQRARGARLRDLWEVRASIEVEAARLAAQRRTQGDLDHLALLLERRGDGDALCRHDRAFHRYIVAASRNQALVELHDFFTSAILESIWSAPVGAMAEPDDQAYAAIVAAIGTRDVELAGHVARVLSTPSLERRDGSTAAKQLGEKPLYLADNDR